MKTKSAKFMAALMKRNFKHGHATRSKMTGEFHVWTGMIKRCYGVNSTKYSQYGGRGIRVAPEWRYDFAAFFKYMGKRPSPKHQIDRIDNNGNYEPGNVRWVTPKENARNTRHNVLITIGGVTKCAAAWDEYCGFKGEGKTVLHRFQRGWRENQLLLPLKTRVITRKQSPAERKTRSLSARRVHRLDPGLRHRIAKKVSATKLKQWAEKPNQRARDDRGCFA